MQITSSDQPSVTAGQIYEIPFPEGTGTSRGNTIELAVANVSNLTAEGVKVAVTNTPAWIKFASQADTLPQIKAKEEQTASFNFSVDKTAEVNKNRTLTFSISDKSGQVWTKEITIKVLPPAHYELFQNYPNPYNPTTKIEYQLPVTCTVNLIVYDILGREAAHLVNEQQDAGYHQATFDAHHLASGMYIYRLLTTDEQNKHHLFQKKMLMLK